MFKLLPAQLIIGQITPAQIQGPLPSSLIGQLGVLNPNPYFSGGDSSGWSSNNNPFHVTNTQPGGSGFPYAITQTSGGAGEAITESAPGGPFAVVPGPQILVSAWVYDSSGSVGLGLGFHDSGQNFLGSAMQTFAVPVNTWTQLVTVQTVPATIGGGVPAFAYPRVADQNAGAVIYAAAVVCLPQVPGSLIQAGTVTATQIAAATITGAQIAASVSLSSPVITGGTITGAQIIADGSSGEFLAYTAAPATGNLLVSISGLAGTDGFSNAYAQGFQVHGPSGQSIILAVSAGFAKILYPTGAAEEVAGAFDLVSIVNPGASEILSWVIRGAQSNTATRGLVSISLNSDAKDASSGAVGVLGYVKNVTFTAMANWSATGFRVLAGGIPGDGQTYQCERFTMVQAAGVAISTTAQTQFLSTMTLGQGEYLIEGQIVLTPAAAGGVATFEFSSGGGLVAGSNGVSWDAITFAGAPYTNLGSSYQDPGLAVAFSSNLTTTAKQLIRFRFLINVATAGTLGIFASETGGGSYTIDSRQTFAHLYPVGP